VSLAQRKFKSGLEGFGIEMDFLPIIEEAFAATTRDDRGLRDTILGTLYKEVQYWINRDNFMGLASQINCFCPNMSRYTAKRDAKIYREAIKSIEEPGDFQK